MSYILKVHGTVRHGIASCGILVLPHEDLSQKTSVVHGCPGAGSLRRHDHVNMCNSGNSCTLFIGTLSMLCTCMHAQ